MPLRFPPNARKPLGWTALVLSLISWIAVPVVAFIPSLTPATKVVLGGSLYGFSWATWALCMLLLGPEMLQLMARVKASFRRNRVSPDESVAKSPKIDSSGPLP